MHYNLLFLLLFLLACEDKSNTETNNTNTVANDEIKNDSGLPNILLIIADDMGLDASPVHSEGSQKPQMPTLENLSANGLTFDNLWTNPLCTPTRATILTGKYGIHTGVLSVEPPDNGIATTEVSLQTYLKQQSSYNSAVIGKWHLSNASNGDIDNPAMLGIEHYVGLIKGSHSDYSDWTVTENGVSSNSTQYSTSYFTDKSIDWIMQQQTGENTQSPWFLWLAYTAPHTPFHLPPTHLLSNNSLSGNAIDINQNPLSYYLAMLEALDTEMARLLEVVDMENTIIIFIGDNGTPAQVAQAPYNKSHAKASVYQGGINTPMVVAGKGVSRIGEREAALINSTDLFATIADIADTGTDAIHDSLSFKGLLSGTATVTRTFTYAEIIAGVDAWTIRNTQYKLLEFSDGTQELYDLEQDPYESVELISLGLIAEQSAAKLALEQLATSIRSSQ